MKPEGNETSPTFHTGELREGGQRGVIAPEIAEDLKTGEPSWAACSVSP